MATTASLLGPIVMRDRPLCEWCMRQIGNTRWRKGTRFCSLFCYERARASWRKNTVKG